MLERAPQINGLLGQLGLLEPNPQGELPEVSAYGRDFALQLHALMATGRLPNSALENATVFQELGMDSFSALSEHLPFEVDPNSGQDLFSQLSDWLADQGIVTDAVRNSSKGMVDLIGSLNSKEPISTDLKLEGVVASFDENSLLRFGDLRSATKLMTGQVSESDGNEYKALTLGEQPLDVDQQKIADLDAVDVSEDAHKESLLDGVQPKDLMGVVSNQQNSGDKQNQSRKQAESDVEKLTEKAKAMMAAHSGVVSDESLEERKELDIKLDTTHADLDLLESEQELATELAEPALIESTKEAKIEDEAPLIATGQVASEVEVTKLATEGQASLPIDAELSSELETEQESDALDEDLMTPVFASQSVTQSQQAAASVQNSTMGSMSNAPQMSNMMRQAQASLGQKQGTDAQSPKPNLDVSAGQMKSLQEAVSQLMVAQQQTNQNQQLQSLQNLNSREAMAQLQQEVLRQSEAKQAASDSLEESVETTATGQVTDRKTGLPSLASIHYPMRHPQWAQAVGKRVVFMANNQLQQAQISLSPEKLGPIQIRLQVDRDQMVSVSMTAHHGATREALEQAIPRLKEMLEEAGIDFDSVNVDEESVFEQTSNQQQDSKNGRGSKAPGLVDGNEASESQPSETRILETNNMVDYYA